MTSLRNRLDSPTSVAVHFFVYLSLIMVLVFATVVLGVTGYELLSSALCVVMFLLWVVSPPHYILNYDPWVVLVAGILIGMFIVLLAVYLVARVIYPDLTYSPIFIIPMVITLGTYIVFFLFIDMHRKLQTHKEIHDT